MEGSDPSLFKALLASPQKSAKPHGGVANVPVGAAVAVGVAGVPDEAGGSGGGGRAPPRHASRDRSPAPRTATNPKRAAHVFQESMRGRRYHESKINGGHGEGGRGRSPPERSGSVCRFVGYKNKKRRKRGPVEANVCAARVSAVKCTARLRRGAAPQRGASTETALKRSPDHSGAFLFTRDKRSAAMPDAAMNARASSLSPNASSSGFPCAITLP